MTGRMIDNRVAKIMELEAAIAELKKDADAIKAEIQDAMAADGVDEIRTGKYVVRSKVIVTNRFDSKAFQKDHKALYSAYLKEASSVRFTHDVIRG